MWREQCYGMANTGAMGHRGRKVIPWHTTRAHNCYSISDQGAHPSSAKEEMVVKLDDLRGPLSLRGKKIISAED